jgi:hypothetical protein
MELTNQAPEFHPAAAGALTPQDTPTPAENVRAWWKKARRVYPEATLRAWRFDITPTPKRAAAVAGVTLDRRRLHRILRRDWQETRHRSPVSRHHLVRTSSGQNHQSK